MLGTEVRYARIFPDECFEFTWKKRRGPAKTMHEWGQNQEHLLLFLVATVTPALGQNMQH